QSAAAAPELDRSGPIERPPQQTPHRIPHFKKQLISWRKNTAHFSEDSDIEKDSKAASHDVKTDQGVMGSSSPDVSSNPQPNRFEAYPPVSSSGSYQSVLIPRPGAFEHSGLSAMRMVVAVPPTVLVTQARGLQADTVGPSPVSDNDTQSVDSLGSIGVELQHPLSSRLSSGGDLDARLPPTPVGHIRRIRESPSLSSNSKSRADWSSTESTPNNFKVPTSSPYLDLQTQQTSPLSLVIQKAGTSSTGSLSAAINESLMKKSGVHSDGQVFRDSSLQHLSHHYPFSLPVPIQEVSARDERVPFRKRSITITTEDSTDSDVQYQGTSTPSQAASCLRGTSGSAATKTCGASPPAEERGLQTMAPPSTPGVASLPTHLMNYPLYPIKHRQEIGGRAGEHQAYKDRPFLREAGLPPSKVGPPPLMTSTEVSHQHSVSYVTQSNPRSHLPMNEESSQNVGKEDDGRRFWRFPTQELREMPREIGLLAHMSRQVPSEMRRWPPEVQNQIVAHIRASQNLSHMYHPHMNQFLLRGRFPQSPLLDRLQRHPPDYPSAQYYQQCHGVPERHTVLSADNTVKKDIDKEHKQCQENSPDDSLIVVDDSPDPVLDDAPDPVFPQAEINIPPLSESVSSGPGNIPAVSESSSLEGLGESLQHHVSSQKLLSDGKSKISALLVPAVSPGLTEAPPHTPELGPAQPPPDSAVVGSGTLAVAATTESGGSSLSGTVCSAADNGISSTSNNTANTYGGSGVVESGPQNDDLDFPPDNTQPLAEDQSDGARPEQAGKLGKFLMRVNRGSVDHSRAEASTPLSVIGVGDDTAGVVEDAPPSSREEPESSVRQHSHGLKEPNFEVSLSETQLSDLRNIHQFQQDADRQFSRGFKKSITEKFEDDNATSEVDTVPPKEDCISRGAQNKKTTATSSPADKTTSSDHLGETLSILKVMAGSSKDQSLLDVLEDKAKDAEDNRLAKGSDSTLDKPFTEAVGGCEITGPSSLNFLSSKGHLLPPQDDSDADSVRTVHDSRIIGRRSSSSSQSSNSSGFSGNSPPPFSPPRSVGLDSSDEEEEEIRRPPSPIDTGEKDLVSASCLEPLKSSFLPSEREVATTETEREVAATETEREVAATEKLTCEDGTQRPRLPCRQDLPNSPPEGEETLFNCSEENLCSSSRRDPATPAQGPASREEPPTGDDCRSPSPVSVQGPDTPPHSNIIPEQCLASQSSQSPRVGSLSRPGQDEALTRGALPGRETDSHPVKDVESAVGKNTPDHSDQEIPKLVLKLPTKGALKAFTEDLLPKMSREKTRPVALDTPDSSSEVTSTTPDNPVLAVTLKKGRGRPKSSPQRKPQRRQAPQVRSNTVKKNLGRGTRKGKLFNDYLLQDSVPGEMSSRDDYLSDKTEPVRVTPLLPAASEVVPEAQVTRRGRRRACANVSSYAEFFDSDAPTPLTRPLPILAPLPQVNQSLLQIKSARPLPEMPTDVCFVPPSKRRRGRPRKNPAAPAAKIVPKTSVLLSNNIGEDSAVVREGLASSDLPSSATTTGEQSSPTTRVSGGTAVTEERIKPQEAKTPTQTIQTTKRPRGRPPKKSNSAQLLSTSDGNLSQAAEDEQTGRTTARDYVQTTPQPEPRNKLALEAASPQLVVKVNKDSKLKITIRRAVVEKRGADCLLAAPQRKKRKLNHPSNPTDVHREAGDITGTVERCSVSPISRESPETLPLHCDPHDPLGIDLVEDSRLGPNARKNIYEFDDDVSDEDVPVAQRLKSLRKKNTSVYRRVRKIVRNAKRTPAHDPNFSYLKTPNRTPCHTPVYSTPSYTPMYSPMYTPVHRINYTGPGSTPRHFSQDCLKIRLRKKPRSEQHVILKIKNPQLDQLTSETQHQEDMADAIDMSRSLYRATEDDSCRTNEENNNSKGEGRDDRDDVTAAASPLQESASSSGGVNVRTFERGKVPRSRIEVNSPASEMPGEATAEDPLRVTEKSSHATLEINPLSGAEKSTALTSDDSVFVGLEKTSKSSSRKSAAQSREKSPTSRAQRSEARSPEDTPQAHKTAPAENSSPGKPLIPTLIIKKSLISGFSSTFEETGDRHKTQQSSRVERTDDGFVIPPTPVHVMLRLKRCNSHWEQDEGSRNSDKTSDFCVSRGERQRDDTEATTDGGVTESDATDGESTAANDEPVAEVQVPLKIKIRAPAANEGLSNVENIDEDIDNGKHEEKPTDCSKTLVERESQRKREQSDKAPSDATTASRQPSTLPPVTSTVNSSSTNTSAPVASPPHSPNKSQLDAPLLETPTNAPHHDKPSVDAPRHKTPPLDDPPANSLQKNSSPGVPRPSVSPGNSPQSSSPHESTPHRVSTQSSSSHSVVTKPPSATRPPPPNSTPRSAYSSRVDSVELELAAILGSPNKGSERIESSDSRALDDADLEALLLGDKSVRSVTPTVLHEFLDKRDDSAPDTSPVVGRPPRPDEHRPPSPPGGDNNEAPAPDTPTPLEAAGDSTASPREVASKTFLVQDIKLKTPPKVMLQKLSPDIICTFRSSSESGIQAPKKQSKRLVSSTAPPTGNPTAEDVEDGNVTASPEATKVVESAKKRILTSPSDGKESKKPRRSERKVRSGEGCTPVEAKLERSCQSEKAQESCPSDLVPQRPVNHKSAENIEPPTPTSRGESVDTTTRDGRDDAGPETGSRPPSCDKRRSSHVTETEEDPTSSTIVSDPGAEARVEGVVNADEGKPKPTSASPCAVDGHRSRNVAAGSDAATGTRENGADDSTPRNKNSSAETGEVNLRQSSRLRQNADLRRNTRGRSRGRGTSSVRRSRIKSMAIIDSSSDSPDESFNLSATSKMKSKKMVLSKGRRKERTKKKTAADNVGQRDPDLNKKTVKNLIFNNAIFQASVKRTVCRIFSSESDNDDCPAGDSNQRPTNTKISMPTKEGDVQAPEDVDGLEKRSMPARTTSAAGGEGKNKNAGNSASPSEAGEDGPTTTDPKVPRNKTKSTSSASTTGKHVPTLCEVVDEVNTSAGNEDTTNTREKPSKTPPTARPRRCVREENETSEGRKETSEGRKETSEGRKETSEGRKETSEGRKEENEDRKRNGSKKQPVPTEKTSVNPVSESLDLPDDIEETLRRLDGSSPNTSVGSPPPVSTRSNRTSTSDTSMEHGNSGSEAESRKGETEGASVDKSVKVSDRDSTPKKADAIEDESKKSPRNKDTAEPTVAEDPLTPGAPSSKERKPAVKISPKQTRETQAAGEKNSSRGAKLQNRVTEVTITSSDEDSNSAGDVIVLDEDDSCDQGKGGMGVRAGGKINGGAGGGLSRGAVTGAALDIPPRDAPARHLRTGSGGKGGSGGDDGSAPTPDVHHKSIQYSDGVSDHDSEYRDSMWNMAFLTPERRERDEISPPQPDSPEGFTCGRGLRPQQVYPTLLTLQLGSFESPVRRDHSESSTNLDSSSGGASENRTHKSRQKPQGYVSVGGKCNGRKTSAGDATEKLVVSPEDSTAGSDSGETEMLPVEEVEVVEGLPQVLTPDDQETQDPLADATPRNDDILELGETTGGIDLLDADDFALICKRRRPTLLKGLSREIVVNCKSSQKSVFHPAHRGDGSSKNASSPSERDGLGSGSDDDVVKPRQSCTAREMSTDDGQACERQRDSQRRGELRDKVRSSSVEILKSPLIMPSYPEEYLMSTDFEVKDKQDDETHSFQGEILTMCSSDDEDDDTKCTPKSVPSATGRTQRPDDSSKPSSQRINDSMDAIGFGSRSNSCHSPDIDFDILEGDLFGNSRESGNSERDSSPLTSPDPSSSLVSSSSRSVVLSDDTSWECMRNIEEYINRTAPKVPSSHCRSSPSHTTRSHAQVSATTIDGAQVSATTIDDAQVSATTIDDAQVSATTIDDAQVSATTIDDAQVSATTIDDAQVSATTIEDAQVSAKEDTQLSANGDAQISAKTNDDAQVSAKEDAQLSSEKKDDAQVLAKDDAQVSAKTKDDAQMSAKAKEDSQLSAKNKDDVQVSAKTKDDAQVLAKDDAQVSAKTKDDAQMSAKAKEDFQVSAKNKDDVQVSAKKKDDVQVSAKNKDDAQVSAKKKDDVQVSAKNKDDVQVSAKNKDDVQVSAKTKDDVQVSAENKDDAQVSAKTKDDVQVSAKTNDDVQVSAKNKDDVQVSAKTNDDVQVSAKTNDDVQVSAKNKDDVQVSAKTNDDVQVSAKTKDDVQVSAKNKDDVQVSAKTNDDVQVSAKNKDDVQVSAKTKDDVQVSAKTKDDAQVSAKTKDDAQVSAKTKDDAQVSDKTKDDVQVSAKNKDDVQVSAKTKDDVQVSAKTKDDAQVSAKTKDDAQVSAKTKDDAQVSAKTKDEMQVSAKTKDNAQESAKTKDDAQVSAKTKDAQVSAKNKDDAQVSAKTKDDAQVSAKTKDNAQESAKTKDEMQVSAKTKDNAQVSAKTKEGAQVSAKTKEDAQVSAKTKEDAQVSAKTKEDVQVSAKTKEDAQVSA
ncbi:Ribosome-binding protein 1-like 8, partial [Homarus americanus]